MDRLYTVAMVTAVTLSVSCDDKATTTPAVPASRVNAVVAKKQVAESPEDFCDVYHSSGGQAPEMVYPELSSPLGQIDRGWAWVNVWATWCKPCIEEMPRLVGWQTELAADGLGGVVFVSADDTEEIMSAFLQEHADLPSSTRLAKAEELQTWIHGLGLDGSVSLPAHIFVDANNKVRCIRMGGVSDQDRGAVRRLLSGE